MCLHVCGQVPMPSISVEISCQPVMERSEKESSKINISNSYDRATPPNGYAQCTCQNAAAAAK